MNNDTTELVEKLRRELHLTRIITTVSILLAICLAGLVLYFQQTVQTAVEPITEQLSEMDTDTLNEAIANLETISDELAQADIDWEKFSETVNSLDVDAINEAIAGLDTEGLSEAIAGLDTEELSEAIENLNDAIEALQNLGSGTSTLTDWLFGGD